jgi:hypothetical protein
MEAAQQATTTLQAHPQETQWDTGYGGGYLGYYEGGYIWFYSRTWCLGSNPSAWGHEAEKAA